LLFFGTSANLHAASGYIWGHNFWTNQDLDSFSISKWPSEPQFCEKETYIWKKNGQKGSYNSRLSVSFISDQSIVERYQKMTKPPLLAVQAVCIFFQKFIRKWKPVLVSTVCKKVGDFVSSWNKEKLLLKLFSVQQT
jgi:hypothetical protein